MMIRRNSTIALFAIIAILAGCQTSSTYYWAHYEPVIYSNYLNPGELPPQEQIELFKQDIAEAQTKGLPLPPGFYAQLGYLYSQIGDTDTAITSFKTEKENYPESAVFMDRLIGKVAN